MLDFEIVMCMFTTNVHRVCYRLSAEITGKTVYTEKSL